MIHVRVTTHAAELRPQHNTTLPPASAPALMDRRGACRAAATTQHKASARPLLRLSHMTVAVLPQIGRAHV